jgi:ABC-type uncharacterized transport system permease subunit
MNGFEQALTTGIEGGTVILYPALGELISERAGVVNLGTEGAMLAGALAAFAAGSVSGSAWIGVLAGIFGGSLVGAAHAWCDVGPINWPRDSCCGSSRSVSPRYWGPISSARP